MGSSKQLSKSVRMKMVHFHQEREGYKKLPYIFHFQIMFLTVEIGTVEVKARSVRNSHKNPYFTAKEMHNRVAGTALAVHRTTIQHTLNSKDLCGRVARKKPFLRPQHKMKHLKYAKENIEKPEAFWNNVL